MGLLDDAIREHLELKRRSGEDARKLAQLEHEAFGPIRRGDPALDLQPPGAQAPEEAAEAQAQDARPDDLFDAEPVAREEPPAFEPLTVPEPAPEPELPEPAVAHEPELTPAPAPAPEPEPYVPPAPDPLPEPSAPADQPTQAFSLSDLEALADDEPSASAPAPPPPPAPVEEPTAPHRVDPQPETVPAQDVVPADDEPGEHDVLEETPEFLEETPEHDRLWFEQKPPRDFDF